MTLEEFLAWDAPDPGRWQLIDGVPVAMVPAGRTQGRLQATVAALIDNHLNDSGSPCVARQMGHGPMTSRQPLRAPSRSPVSD